MSLYDIRLPERHWLVLAAAFAFSSFSVWMLLASYEQTIEVSESQNLTKLKLAPTGAAVALLEKPLFNKARAPVSSSEDGALLADGMGAEAVPPPPAPTLVGIATGRGKAVAILKGIDGTARNMTAGDSIDGWTVVSISRAAARISAGGVTQNISLNYSNQQAGSTAPAIAANAPPERGN